jgi:sugar phosphate isomerase/epimerase
MGYLDYTTLEDAVRRIGRMGYEVVDFWAYSPHLGPDLYDKKARQQVMNVVKESGLEAVALSVNGGGLALHINFSHSIEAIRKKSVEYYIDCIDMAAEMGIPIVNMISGHMIHGTQREQAWEWNRECMHEVVKRAEEKHNDGASYATRCESRVMVTLDDALQMMREINRRTAKS